MRAEFDKLVQELDDTALVALHQSVTSEAEDTEKDQASAEIARALREQS